MVYREKHDGEMTTWVVDIWSYFACKNITNILKLCLLCSTCATTLKVNTPDVVNESCRQMPVMEAGASE